MLTAYFDRFTIDLPLEVVQACSHSGPCDSDVEYCLTLPTVDQEFNRLDPAEIRAELAEYGAWDSDELSDDTANRGRVLWLAAGQILDSLDEDH